MKNILKIVKTDFMNVAKNPAAIIVILALSLLPSLYAWLNIAASWDPYSNTRGVAVAVSSQDEGAEVDGEEVNIGDEVIKSLAKNEQLGWKFVTKEEAIDGVKYGDYYGAIIIPEDFSEKLVSVTSDDIEKPGIDYYMNEKVNAISPKVTGSGASAVVENIQSNFVKEVNETILTAFNDLGISLDDNYTSIENMRDAVFELEENLPEIESLMHTADRDLDLAKDATKRASENVDRMYDVQEDMYDTNDRLRDRLQSSNESVQDLLVRIADSLGRTKNSVEDIYDTTDRIRNKDGSVDDLIDALERQKDRVDDTNDRLDELIDFLLDADDRIKEKERLSKLLDRLQEQEDDLIDLQDRLNERIADLEENGYTDSAAYRAIERLIHSINTTIDEIAELSEDVILTALDRRIDEMEDLKNTYDELEEWFRLDANKEGKPSEKKGGPYANYIETTLMPTMSEWKVAVDRTQDDLDALDKDYGEGETIPEEVKRRLLIRDEAPRILKELERYKKGTGDREGYEEMRRTLDERIILMKAYNAQQKISKKEKAFNAAVIQDLEEKRKQMDRTVRYPSDILSEVLYIVERIESGATKEEVVDRLTRLNTLLEKAPEGDTLLRKALQQLQQRVESMLKEAKVADPRVWTPFLVESAGQIVGADTDKPTGLQAAMNDMRQSIEDARRAKGSDEVKRPEDYLFEGVDGAVKELKDRRQKIEDRIESLRKQAAENVILFQDLKESLENPTKMIDLLKRIEERVAKSITNIEDLQQSVETLMDDIDNMEFFENQADRVRDLQEQLDDFKDSIDRSIGRIEDSRQNVGESLDKMDERIADMSQSLQESIDNIHNDISPSFDDRFQSAIERVDRADEIADKIGDVVPRLQDVITRVDDAVTTGREKLDVVEEHFPEAKDAVLEIADKIREFEKEGNLDELINFLKNDPSRVSDFFASPVNLDEHKLYPIPTYGSAMSPFYTVLAFWVGGLILVSTLKVDIDNKEEYRSYEAYFGRLFTFVTIGIAQAGIVTIGDIYLLDAYVVDRLMFVLLGIFVSVVFITIIYTLVSIFGNTGKVLAIILLVTQIGGSGGTFPVQMAPDFFQEIHRFLPFTHGITLMREAVGGLIWSVVLKNIAYMSVYLFIAIIAGVALKKFFNRSSDKFMERARQSKMIM